MPAPTSNLLESRDKILKTKQKFGLDGIREVEDGLELALGNMLVATGFSCVKAALDVLELSTEYVPVDTGSLRYTGHVDVVKGSGGRSASGAGRSEITGRFVGGVLGVRINYGDEPHKKDKPALYKKPGLKKSKFVHYATEVHETHKTKSKFLERAMSEVAEQLGPKISRAGIEALIAAARKKGWRPPTRFHASRRPQR